MNVPRLAALSLTRRPTPAEEEMLVVLARTTAARFHKHNGLGSMEHEDLISEAMLGAWVAFLTYDASKGYALRSWVIERCRRAVQDAYREADILSRTQRERYQAAVAADPDTKAPRELFSLDAIQSQIDRDDGDGKPRRTPPALIAADRIEPMLALWDREQKAAVAHRALVLWDRDRTLGISGCRVMHLLLVEALTAPEAAVRLGCSESRIWQVRKEALAVMRRAIKGMK